MIFRLDHEPTKINRISSEFVNELILPCNQLFALLFMDGVPVIAYVNWFGLQIYLDHSCISHVLSPFLS
jgi:hypothetical protein